VHDYDIVVIALELHSIAAHAA